MRNIYMYAYWKKRNLDDINIGYGVNKKLLINGLVLAAMLVLISIIGIIYTSNKEIIYFIIAGNVIFTSVYIYIMHKNIGWYQINDKGEIMKKISNGFFAPSEIKNRRPISKDQFLKEEK